MEDIMQILIFVGAMVIAVVGQNAKNKKKPTNASPQEVLEDMFPDIHEVQETTVFEQKSTSKTNSSLKRTPHKIPTTTQSADKPNIDSSSKKNTKKISLSCREEAKRAFIYSEIFNRKY
ncbi:MAG: hypothetical protein IKU64_07070 [Bacteroides sp.]|nr:hypothetical protein [Bacteroides sp.]